MAAKIMPVPANTAYQGPSKPGHWALSGVALNAPIRHKNSLTKPFRPGTAKEDKTKKTIKADQIGMLATNPPKRFMSRV